MSEAEQRAAVIAEARSWLNTPYHHAGRLKGIGVDCAMLPAEVYAAAGLIPRIEPAAYPSDWHLHRDAERYLDMVLRHARPVEQPGPGDFVLFRFGRCLSHGGIVLTWPRIIHAYIRQGVVEADAGQEPLAGRERVFFSLWSG